MIKKDNVIAITVTYNRMNTLKKTINALINQSYELEKIIIVDNNSSEEHKNELKDLEKNNDLIEVIWKNENLGGAGGFYYGMKIALEKYNPDWYWLMDDDAYPTKMCLFNLLNKKNNLDNIGFLAPTIYGLDNKKYQMYHHKLISDNKVDDITAVKRYEDLRDVVEIEANAFVGPLFSKKSVQALGLPDKGLFIYGDDTEYTYRISRQFKGYLIKDAIINHQDPPLQGNTVIPESWWKEYYMFRNRFLFIDKFQNGEKKKESFKIIKRRINKKILATLIKPNYRGFRKVRIELLRKAIIDGENKVNGKTIDPVIYISKIKDIRKKLQGRNK